MMPTVRGIARVDVRTKRLVPRLKPGEIVVIDHRDLDGLSASALVERRPAAVINASPSISGRYPNRGPSILVRAGIPLVDVECAEIMSLIREGDLVEIDEAEVRCRNRSWTGARLTLEDVEAALQEARSFLGAEIEAFARNTLEYIERERHLVLDNLDIPDLRTVLANRHAVVVVRGEGFKQDLEAILPYIREVRPVLIAVDGGADALLEHDLTPHLIVGDMDSVSDNALGCGAEIVVHSYPRPGSLKGEDTLCSNSLSIEAGLVGTSSEGSANGTAASSRDRAPGFARLEALGLEGKVFSVAGTSEDMAMLIAYEKGAELIVAVGTHFSLVDFLDKGRPGMASTFLVRLRVGSCLVDARGVSALYQTGPGLGFTWHLLLAAASVPVLAMAVLSPGVRASLSLGYILFRGWLRRHGA